MKVDQMKFFIFWLLPCLAFAQTTLKSSLPGHKSELPQVKKIDETLLQATQDNQELMALLTVPATDSCLIEELKIRKANNDFLIQNQKQISEIVGSIQQGFYEQLKILKGYQNGTVAGAPLETLPNAEGKMDSSAVIRLLKKDQTTEPDSYQVILVKDLMKYIKKFEAAAQSANTDKEITALLTEFDASATETDPAYYKMTLTQATHAYQKLGTMFQRSLSVEKSRSFEIGTGKNIFRISTTTTLGWNPKYQGWVKSQLVKDKNQIQNQTETTRISWVQNWGDAFRQMEENQYWKIIQEQQLTVAHLNPSTSEIVSIPIDGLLRREYFESTRSVACLDQNGRYEFIKHYFAGPNLPYDQKEICKRKGIKVLTAALVKDNGNGLSFAITEELGKLADQKIVYNSTGIYNLFPTAHLRSCDYIELQINYECDCGKKMPPFKEHYKADRGFTLSCNL
jgi:hypothetical protein